MKLNLAAILFACVLAPSGTGALAVTDDEAFLAAREAFQQGSFERLTRAAVGLQDQTGGDPLSPRAGDAKEFGAPLQPFDDGHRRRGRAMLRRRGAGGPWRGARR